MKRIVQNASLCAVLLLLIAHSAAADTHHWNGDGDGTSWNDPDNWVEDAVPAMTGDGEGADDAEISGDYTVRITANVSSIHALTLTGDATNQPTVTIDPGITFKCQSIVIEHGGLVLDTSVASGDAQVLWAKANRGQFTVQSDGYIAGDGLIKTTCSTGSGIKLMSTRSTDFDMTGITLHARYRETIRVCSIDQGRGSAADWIDNFAIGKLILGDYRHNHPLLEADGTMGGDTNALYCHELEFEGAWNNADGAQIDLRGTSLYVRDKVTWYDNSTSETSGQLTVATSYDVQDPTTAIWDDDTPQGEAWLGFSSPPVADAGADIEVTDTDGNDVETVTLDGSASSDPDGTITSYVWTEDAQQIATGQSPQVSLGVGRHEITLTVTDNDSKTDTDTVTVWVNPQVISGIKNWNGRGDGVTWSDADNWCEDAVPVTTGDGETADQAVIDGDYTVSITSNVTSINKLTLAGDETDQPTVTVQPGVTLKLQSINVAHGGLILATDGQDHGEIQWSKANRGGLTVAADGYIAGTGLIKTLCSTGTGIKLMSTRASDFDMTGITLYARYQEKIRVCSLDLGHDSTDDWVDNFVIGTLYLGDGRHNHNLYQADGSTGGGTNALYCHHLKFEKLYGQDTGARLNLQGTGVNVRDQITWYDSSTLTTAGPVDVATAFDGPDETTSLWDDDTPQGEASMGVWSNTPPMADAGTDQEVTDTDGGGTELVTLDASGSTDDDAIASYVWSEDGQQIATGQSPQVSLATGKHVITLVVSDSEDWTDSDTVTVWVNPQVVAGVKNWNGRGDGVSWTDADNWCEDAVPVTTSDGETADTAKITGDYTVTIGSNVTSIKKLVLDGDTTHQPTVTIGAGVLLKLQALDIVHGGLILGTDGENDATISWAKTNRGYLTVHEDGYIAGTGLISTLTSGSGVKLMSTRANDFDMTNITLRLRYAESLRVCSSDIGGATSAAWANNFAIGKLVLGDGRHNHNLYQADGSTGGGTNALYVLHLEFEGLYDKSSGARLNLQGTGVYVRDQITWFDDSVSTAGDPTVATAFDSGDVTTSLWDDDTPQGTAQLRPTDHNEMPVADAGPDQIDFTITTSKVMSLDGTGSTDFDGSLVSYVWKEGTTTLATGSTANVSLDVGVHEITLIVTDNEGGTDDDEVTVSVEPAFPLWFKNNKSGISVSLSGTNGTDWAVEHTFHDELIADQVVYLSSDVDISLAHNAHNTVTHYHYPWHVIGEDGHDGSADTGDEGEIYYKIDRDLQSLSYTTQQGTMPTGCVAYSAAFDFDSLTYDGVTDVLGSTGDNGGNYGSEPSNTTSLFAYGQVGPFGNEWHTLTYWDDDYPLLSAYAATDPEFSVHRQAASDGHCLFVCVNPTTPIIQFRAPSGEQYYTTPIKTYHVPKIWEQTTYATGGTYINFVNITNGDTIYYRVAGGNWTSYDGSLMTVDDIISASDTEVALDVRLGAAGTVLTRTIVKDPSFSGASETHGYLLWADASERTQLDYKLENTAPFTTAYSNIQGSQSLGATYGAARGIWRAGANLCPTILNNAFVAAIDGPATAPDSAAMAKLRLLRLARLAPVGFERDVNNSTPAKDYMNELSQTMHLYADAGVAYDLLASCYRSTQHTGGITPVEEYRIRDGLAEVAKTTLQIRSNYSAHMGGGDTHWAHGYEQMIGIMALAMPTYKTEYYGVSGGDLTSVNDLYDCNGKYWNPFPDQGVTWYACCTDPEINTPGHPGVRYPFRAQFLLSDDGWWVGPNDLKGDGDRYYDGYIKDMLVDINYGGIANCDARIEMVEMQGYESPFPVRTIAFDYMRRLAGDNTRTISVTNYIRRLGLNGYVPLSWSSVNEIYTTNAPSAYHSLCQFNDHYEHASLTGAIILVGDYLDSGNATGALSNPYAVSMCWDPDDIGSHTPEPNQAPYLKPLYRHTIEVGEDLWKEVIAVDPDDDTMSVSVSNLPQGATWDSQNWSISWSPQSGDEGVYIITVDATDGTATRSRPFPVCVKTQRLQGSLPSNPQNFTATVNQQGDVDLDWDAPTGVTVEAYLIYRDGVLWAAVPGNVTSVTDDEIVTPLTHTRYHVSLIDDNGTESTARSASPAVLSIPED